MISSNDIVSRQVSLVCRTQRSSNAFLSKGLNSDTEAETESQIVIAQKQGLICGKIDLGNIKETYIFLKFIFY